MKGEGLTKERGGGEREGGKKVRWKKSEVVEMLELTLRSSKDAS